MTKLYKRRDGAMQTEIDSDTVLLDMDLGFYFTFEGAASSSIWKLIEAPRSEDEIVQGLTAEFDVEPDACRAEVRAFLASLAREGLVTVSEGQRDRPSAQRA